MTEVEHLVEVSRAVGRDVLLVQGGGGNASVKSADGTRMWIKASGFRLADVGTHHGYVATDVPALLAAVRDPRLTAMSRAEAHEMSVRMIDAATRDGGRLRPSLETGFHAVLPGAVLHTHSVFINAFSCFELAEEAVAARLGGAPFVAYQPPGHALAAAVDEVWRTLGDARRATTRAIVLGNHGLIALGPTAADALAATRQAVAAAEAVLGPLGPEACAEAASPPALVEWAQRFRVALAGLRGAPVTARPTKFAALLTAAMDPERWLCAGPLVPDDVVYCGRRVGLVDKNQSPEAWVAAEAPLVPHVVAVAGLGVVLAGPSAAAVDAIDETLLAHVLVRRLVARGGRPRPLPADEVRYLVAMESEHYRAKVAAGEVDGGTGTTSCRS